MLLRSLLLAFFSLMMVGVTSAQVPEGPQLPNTEPLVLEDPLDVVMVRGINLFAERELAASPVSA